MVKNYSFGHDFMLLFYHKFTSYKPTLFYLSLLYHFSPLPHVFNHISTNISPNSSPFLLIFLPISPDISPIFPPYFPLIFLLIFPYFSSFLLIPAFLPTPHTRFLPFPFIHYYLVPVLQEPEDEVYGLYHHLLDLLSTARTASSLVRHGKVG